MDVFTVAILILWFGCIVLYFRIGGKDHFR